LELKPVAAKSHGVHLPEIVEQRGWTGFRDIEFLVRPSTLATV
jgi:shikimate kinase